MLITAAILSTVSPSTAESPAAPLAAPTRAPVVLEATAGQLGLVLLQTDSGIQIGGLYDEVLGERLVTSAGPLFSITLLRSGNHEERQLESSSGWRQTNLRRSGARILLGWTEPADPALRGLSVKATARADAGRSAWCWQLRVENESTEWSVKEVQFPQLTLLDPGAGSDVLFPRGPGEVQKDVWNRAFAYRGNYPGGWCAMQFLAAYRPSPRPTGLYLGLHDPWGGTKDLEVKSDPATRTVHFRYLVPAPGLGQMGNDFELPGEAVWQLLRGDWYDAAVIYRDWVCKEARWWPRLSADGRRDTPAWMRQLDAWAMTGGGTNDCVSAVQAFQQYLDMPIGFHWYNWHQIPFDNDYPHYFPAKPGFADGVAELQRSRVFVMPYINGRLWDTHDRGAEDWQFHSRALAAATKKVDGSPYAESYGSKETNGEPVRLAAMCPATPLWQETVADIVLRLLRDHGTRSVYIDQVAAAAPTLCLDPQHGHPLGGGHWWNEGYWQMLENIRRQMPREAMLTTECNGEPFIRWFDGYLTWHWQFDGQVPAFPAIYGGAIQMFGRAYRGGSTKDLALRMKAAQQLVFGEQLGWLDPGIVREPDNAAFFRQMAQLRSRLHRYFYAGEMVRPPTLAGDIPRVRADWQWSGEWWVSTDAVLTGAWALPRERRLVAIFVNVSDAPVRTTVTLDPAPFGKRTVKPERKIFLAEGLERFEAIAGLATTAEFAPRQGEAWEFRW